MEYTPPPEDYQIKEREWPEPDREKCSVEIAESTPVVEFDESDMGLIAKWGLFRTRAKNDNEDLSDMDNARQSTVAVNSDLYDEVQEVHEAGVAGELAFAQYYDFDFPYSEEGELDDGYDFVIRLGDTGDWLTVDVKATQMTDGGPLLIQQMKGIRADLYFLVDYYQDEERAELVGFTTGAILGDCPIISGNYKEPNFQCNRKRLIPVPDPEEVELIPWERYVEVYQ